MKTRLWGIETIAVAVLSVTAVGQSLSAVQTAQVPFPFVVSDKTLPAGTYVLTKVGETALRISNSAGQSMVVQPHKVEGRVSEGSGRLVFHRYSNVYFLSEVWSPAQDIGLQLFRSRAELKLQNQEGEMHIAELRLQK